MTRRRKKKSGFWGFLKGLGKELTGMKKSLKKNRPTKVRKPRRGRWY